jgi:hypothetical protein
MKLKHFKRKLETLMSTREGPREAVSEIMKMFSVCGINKELRFAHFHCFSGEASSSVLCAAMSADILNWR